MKKSALYFQDKKGALVRINSEKHPSLFQYVETRIDWPPVIEHYNKTSNPFDLAVPAIDLSELFKDTGYFDSELESTELPIFIDSYNCIMFIRLSG